MVPPKSPVNNSGGTNAGSVSGSGAGSAVGGAYNAALRAERYRPRIFGFLAHDAAKLQRWQGAMRDEQISDLEKLEEQGRR